jgi:hypothetical protein
MSDQVENHGIDLDAGMLGEQCHDERCVAIERA